MIEVYAKEPFLEAPLGLTIMIDRWVDKLINSCGCFFCPMGKPPATRQETKRLLPLSREQKRKKAIIIKAFNKYIFDPPSKKQQNIQMAERNKEKGKEATQAKPNSISISIK